MHWLVDTYIVFYFTAGNFESRELQVSLGVWRDSFRDNGNTNFLDYVSAQMPTFSSMSLSTP